MTGTPNKNGRLERAAVENIEIDLLLEALLRRYGYDFRAYSRAGVKRRIDMAMEKTGMERISDLIHSALREKDIFETILGALSINVTEMFRNPSFFAAVRKIIIPELKAHDPIKIWHAGCATGEEVYSMAILLEEAGVKKRSRIFATDMNKVVIKTALEGAYPMGRIEKYESNYRMAGGERSFLDYIRVLHGFAVVKKALRSKITFTEHNLAIDGVFGEMDLIVCRNVLIYFNRELQDRVLGVFAESLSEGGFLCLGIKESVAFSSHNDDFEAVAEGERIYRKKRKQDV